MSVSTGKRPAGLFALWVVALAFGSSGAAAEETGVLLVRAARVLPVSSAPIENGEILIRDGVIQAVGRDLEVPGGARVLEVPGSVVPGFIDGGSTIGTRGPAAEEYRELTPEIRVAEGLDLDDGLEAAYHAGVTTCVVTPGDRNVIGGLGAIVRTAPGPLSEAVLSDDAFVELSLTPAASSGNRSLRFGRPTSFFYRIPTTRMGTVFLARRAFAEALEMPLGATAPLPDEEIDGIQLGEVLTPAGRAVLRESAGGERKIRMRAFEKQEILAALRLGQEFGLPLVLEGFMEGVDFIDEVAEREIDVLLLPGAAVNPNVEDNPNQVRDLPRRLAQAGVRFAFFSDSPRGLTRLRDRVGIDVRFGLGEAEALRALTWDAARIHGIEEAVGSIQPGRRADLIAYSGDPFDITARVLWVMADGRVWREEP